MFRATAMSSGAGWTRCCRTGGPAAVRCGCPGDPTPPPRVRVNLPCTPPEHRMERFRNCGAYEGQQEMSKRNLTRAEPVAISYHFPEGRFTVAVPFRRHLAAAAITAALMLSACAPQT